MLNILVALQNRLARVERDDKGATAVEYGLMVALIAVVIITAVALIGTNLDRLFDIVGNRLAGTTVDGSTAGGTTAP